MKNQFSDNDFLFSKFFVKKPSVDINDLYARFVFVTVFNNSIKLKLTRAVLICIFHFPRNA